MAKNKIDIILWAIPYCLGFMAFAFFIHTPLPWSIIAMVSLLIPLLIVVREIHFIRDIHVVFGFISGKRPVLNLFIGLQLGLLIALYYRHTLNLPLFISDITWFALIAALIGTTEELLFRGFLQGHLQKVNPVLAVVFASLAHSAYKLCLFISPAVPPEVNLMFLFLWTFIAGILLGTLREISKSVIPAILAHALFDILVYGQAIKAPWWVW